MKMRFDISGMFCAACAANVERAVKKLGSGMSANVNLVYSMLTVESESAIDASAVVKAVTDAGYGCALQQDKRAEKQRERRDKQRAELLLMRKRLLFSFVLLFPLMYVAMGGDAGLPLFWWLDSAVSPIGNGICQLVLLIPVIVVNRFYFTDGIGALIRLRPNMFSLISVGCIASIAMSIWQLFTGKGGMFYFDSAAMILTLVSLGKFLETRAKNKTNESVEKLLLLEPPTANVLSGNKETEVPTEKLRVGDIVVVRAGETIPVDGIVENGEAELDCSALTGESLPVSVEKGHKVSAASICRNGFLHIRATSVGEDTGLAGIIRLVEDANATKAPIARLADAISLWFVPAVMLVSLLTFALWALINRNINQALLHAVSVLVISCPCALGLATPLAIMVGTGACAKQGILIKSAPALEKLSAVDTVVFDKTGTLTKGKLSVADFISDNPAKMWSAAAAAEAGSSHPAAIAVLEAAKSHIAESDSVEEFVNLPGKGVYAKRGGKEIIVGNQRLADEFGIETKLWSERLDRLAENGGTVLYVAEGGSVIGLILLRDELRSESASAVRALSQLGIKAFMLTGDSKRNGEKIAAQLGIEAICEVLPDGKEKVISELMKQGRTIAMVGDGINDAPALSRADIGIAIGTGTDIAVESADVVLMRDDPNDVVKCVANSKKCVSTIRANLFWALCYNCIGIPIAAGALSFAGITLTPVLAAAAMCLSSFSVASNSLLLKKRIKK